MRSFIPRLTFAFLLLLTVAFAGQAQVPTGWHSYPVGPLGFHNDVPAHIVGHSNGGFTLGIWDTDDPSGTYYTSSAYIVGADHFGVPQWTTKLSDSSGLRIWDGDTTVEGGSIWAGHLTEDFYYAQSYAARLDAAGNIKWTWTDDSAYFRSLVTHVLSTRDGHHIVSGICEVPAGSSYDEHAYMVKLDSLGNEVWRWKGDYARDLSGGLAEMTVVEHPDSTLFLISRRWPASSGDDLTLYHVSASGSTLNATALLFIPVGGVYDAVRHLFMKPNGNLVYADSDGEYYGSSPFGLYTMRIYEFDTTGSLLNEHEFPPFDYGEMAYATMAQDGSMYVSGLRERIYMDSFQRPSLVKLNPDMSVAWHRELGALSAREADSNLLSSYLTVLGNRVYQSAHLWHQGAAVVVWDTSGFFQEPGFHGRAYVDADGNGQYDSGERTFSDVPIYMNGVEAARTHSGGRYWIDHDRMDTVRLSTDEPDYHSLFSPAGGEHVVAPDPGGLADTLDFIMEPQPGVHDAEADLTVVVSPWVLQTTHTVDIRNQGTEPLVGATATFHFDSLLSVSSSSVSTFSTAGSSASWTLPTIPPGGLNRSTWILDIYPSFGGWSYVACDSIVVEPLATDTLPDNNMATVCYDIAAAYDPNDIQVNWPGAPQAYTHDLQEYGQSPDSLDYLIRFQNTGAAAARDVVVHDTLDLAWLDKFSFRLLGSSHDVAFSVLPPNIAVFTFEDILLPDTSAGWAESMGWVKFRIGLSSPLGEGDQLDNRAAIYFDANPPITTNAARISWSVQDSTGTGTGIGSVRPLQASIYPNPSSGQVVHICLDAALSGPIQGRILDASGRTMRAMQLDFNKGCSRLNTTDLVGGTYRIHLSTPRGPIQASLLIER